MLHHVSIGVSDVGHAAQFYDAVLATLGYRRVMEFLPYAPRGEADDEPRPEAKGKPGQERRRKKAACRKEKIGAQIGGPQNRHAPRNRPAGEEAVTSDADKSCPWVGEDALYRAYHD